MKDNIDFGVWTFRDYSVLIPTVLGMIFSAIFIITDGILWEKVSAVMPRLPSTLRLRFSHQ